MNKQAIFSAAHKTASFMVRTSKSGNFATGKTYAQVFAFYLRKEWESAKIASEKTEAFVISISYEQTKLRSRVKEMGGKWNPDTKTWSVSCKRSQLGALENYIASAKTTTNGNEIVVTSMGYAVAKKDLHKALRAGFDGIETL